MKLIKKEDGLTLVEILLSIVLIASIILIYSGTFITGMRSETAINKRLDVVRIAEGISEILEANTDELENTTISGDSYPFNNFNNINNDLNSLINNEISFLDEAEITRINENDGLYTLEININWNDGNSSHQLVTKIYNDTSGGI